MVLFPHLRIFNALQFPFLSNTMVVLLPVPMVIRNANPMHDPLQYDKTQNGSDECKRDLLVLEMPGGVGLGKDVQHGLAQQGAAGESE